MSYVINLTDYVPPARYDSEAWIQAQIWYSPDNIQTYVLLDTFSLSPEDSNPQQPLSRSFTVSNVPTAVGWLSVTFVDASANQAPTNPVQYPVTTGSGSANPTLLSARYGVRHRIRDGLPALDASPMPFSMVRLENLSDQIVATSTPTETVFQCRYDDVPTQRYMNAEVIPGTLTAYVDGSWTPATVTQDVDQNGNFTLAIAPTQALMITYAWQYLSDGEIDQFVDEARQWLREFSQVGSIPDGLVPALISYASSRALDALGRSAILAPVHAGDSEIDFSKLASSYATASTSQYNKAMKEREEFYTQGPEALDPTAADFSSVGVSAYTPLH